MSDEPGLPGWDQQQRELLARLRAVVEAKDAEVSLLRAELAAERELRRRLELQVAELQRQLGTDSTNSGTPTSREPVGTRERRKAERKARQSSERERRKDRKRGGQPGHPGSGLARERDPDERRDADPPAQCSRSCNARTQPSGSVEIGQAPSLAQARAIVPGIPLARIARVVNGFTPRYDARPLATDFSEHGTWLTVLSLACWSSI